MPKLIKNWDELIGLESENYFIELDEDMCCGWIRPKDNPTDWCEYLSTHTFYGHRYQESTRILQKYGFDVEIDNWDKDRPKLTIGVDSDIVRYNNNLKLPKEPKLTTNQRKIKEFKERVNLPDISDKRAKKIIRACGGDVNRAVSVSLKYIDSFKHESEMIIINVSKKNELIIEED
jgi:hypothetical protein